MIKVPSLECSRLNFRSAIKISSMPIFIFVLFIASQVGAQEQHTIEKSENDDRQYKIITLENGLEAVLVSDHTLKRSAVALAVNVGSYHEREGFWGMAHYLEHMLFLGTEKYPEEGGYNRFISRNGGKNNAYTYMDHTNYMVSIKDDAYEELLDRFADYFKSPLLSKKYINKERHAVHSEWSMKGVYDSVILGHLNGLTLNPKHPVYQFTWGNLQTLNDSQSQTLHQATKKFYQQHYSANRMKVAMVSSRSLEQLERLVKQYFDDIPKKKNMNQEVYPPAITKLQMKKLIRYKPKKDLKKIQLKFVIDNNAKQFLSKPNYFLTYLLNSTMPGTLSNELKKQGYIDSLYAWADPEAFNNAGEFVIDIDLTDKGIEFRDIIISSVFRYLDLIKASGVNKKYYYEISRSLSNSFKFLGKYDEYNYAANLAAKMHKVPVKYLLSSDYAFPYFKPYLIDQVLAQLSVKRARVFYIDKGQQVTTGMKYFDAGYAIETIPKSLQRKWQNPVEKLDFNLPELNRLMPDSFALVDNKVVDKPLVFSSTRGGITYYINSKNFDEPKGQIVINLNSDLGGESATNQSLMQLLVLAIKDSLTQLTSQANTAGMYIAVTPNRGLEITSSGYSNKQLTLMELAFEHITTQQLTQTNFTRLKRKLLSQLKNRTQNALYTQAFDLYNEYLDLNAYSLEEQIKAAQRLKLADLQRLKAELFKNGRLNSLVHGNFEQRSVKIMIANIERMISIDRKVKTQPITFPSYYFFEANEKLVLNANASQPDVALIDAKWESYTPKLAATGKVLAKIVSPALFQQIRTEEQLGYSVGFYSGIYHNVVKQYGDKRKRHKQVAFTWYVQTPVKPPKSMMARFEAFRKSFSERIMEITPEEFEAYKQAVLLPMEQPFKNMYQEQQKYYYDWSRGNYSFDSKEELIAAVKEVSLSDVRRLFTRIVKDDDMGRILVQIKGENFLQQEFIEL